MGMEVGQSAHLLARLNVNRPLHNKLCTPRCLCSLRSGKSNECLGRGVNHPSHFMLQKPELRTSTNEPSGSFIPLVSTWTSPFSHDELRQSNKQQASIQLQCSHKLLIDSIGKTFLNKIANCIKILANYILHIINCINTRKSK